MGALYKALAGTLRGTWEIGPKVARATISASLLASSRTFSLPDKTGTFAMLSDVPTLDATPVNGSTNGITSNAVFDGLAAAQAYAESLVVGLWDDRGSFNASGGAYPSSGGSGAAGAVLKGDIWTISVGGTLPTGRVVEVNDTIRALIDTPGNTQANWAFGKDNLQTSVSGNAGTATALQNARTIDGQSFNGTANITVIAPGTVAATAKATPVDADVFPLADSAASNVLKKVTWANIKATLKTYFDTLYMAVVAGSNDDFMQRKSGAWTFRTVSQVSADLQGSGLAADAVGFRIVPINSQSVDYTIVAADSGKSLYHPSADTAARVWTIPSNSAVAFPVGTVIPGDNDIGAGALTIAINTDTLVLVGAVGSTGSRTVAPGGEFVLKKVATTRWRISGSGIT